MNKNSATTKIGQQTKPASSIAFNTLCPSDISFWSFDIKLPSLQRKQFFGDILSNCSFLGRTGGKSLLVGEFLRDKEQFIEPAIDMDSQLTDFHECDNRWTASNQDHGHLIFFKPSNEVNLLSLSASLDNAKYAMISSSLLSITLI